MCLTEDLSPTLLLVVFFMGRICINAHHKWTSHMYRRDWSSGHYLISAQRSRERYHRRTSRSWWWASRHMLTPPTGNRLLDSHGSSQLTLNYIWIFKVINSLWGAALLGTNGLHHSSGVFFSFTSVVVYLSLSLSVYISFIVQVNFKLLDSPVF